MPHPERSRHIQPLGIYLLLRPRISAILPVGQKKVGMVMAHEGAVRTGSSFNYSREHEALQNVFKLKKGIGLFHEPKLKVAESSWHRQWTHTSAQVQDLCKTDHLIRFEVESGILENKLSAQRKPPRDLEHMLECVSWVIRKIENELPPSRSVIYMRAELRLDFKEVMKRIPGRFYPSVRDDYIGFLRKLHNQEEFEYLRYKRI